MACLVGLFLLLALVSLLVLVALPNGQRFQTLQWSVRGCFVVLAMLLGLSCIVSSMIVLRAQ
ncbi:hypothetical protein [Herpetosiphon geysericola]|uniref:Uncharacterized protein n=1 Tax=Herpetosiphon geysericola TaxID=70996 RepID=A0A0P6Y3F6_9CHLR|nr:hypothetical protein [Herpetosiphon geysericola]KPL90446.1 hypothetical protein SE18_07545 [Herpetosiphon geysericola]